MTPTLLDRGAVISDNTWYRYHLWRQIAHNAGGRVVFVMLNPSTADALEDDATIRKCCGFARRWGFARLDVVNLYAWRARDPRALTRDGHMTPNAIAMAIGPENDAYIADVVRGAAQVVFAWGAHGPECDPTRPDAVIQLVLKTAKCEVGHFGLTANGEPKHPLMLAYATPIRNTYVKSV